MTSEQYVYVLDFSLSLAMILVCLLSGKFSIHRSFNNNELQGSEKIQAAQCIALTDGLDFLADAADRCFGAAC
jgi:hypothetical protein